MDEAASDAVALLGGPPWPDGDRTKWVQKYLLTPHAQAADLRARGVHLRPEVHRNIVLVRALASDQALAVSPPDVDTDGLNAFYEQNAEAYRQPPTVTYWQACWGPDGDEVGARAALETIGGDGESAKVVTDGFRINRERRRLTGPSSAVDAAIIAATPGAELGPVGPSDGERCLLRVIAREGGAIPPLDEVRAEVEAAWRRAQQHAEAQSAERLTPITLHVGPNNQGVWGDAGGVPLDADLFAAIQLVHPTFFFSDDPATLVTNLRTHYTIPRWRASKAPTDLTPHAARTLARTQELAEDRYLASLWHAELHPSTPADPTAVAHCVEAARTHAARPVSMSLFVAVLDGPEATERARARLEAFTDPPLDDLKERGDGYVIVGTTSFTESQDPALFGVLLTASPHAVTGPHNTAAFGASALIVHVASASGPFDLEAARATCDLASRNASLHQHETRLIQRVEIRYDPAPTEVKMP